MKPHRSHMLPERIMAAGLEGKPIETIIDHIEFDEGRDPRVDIDLTFSASTVSNYRK